MWVISSRWLRPCHLYTPPVAVRDWAVSRGLRTAVCRGLRVAVWRETVQSQWLEPGKSRNKVSVGEPADGSSSKPTNGSFDHARNQQLEFYDFVVNVGSITPVRALYVRCLCMTWVVREWRLWLFMRSSHLWWLSLRLNDYCNNIASSFCNGGWVRNIVFVVCTVPGSQETLMISPRRHYETQFSIFKVCRNVCTFMCHNWRLASAMDRLIRVSMKNAASCVIYHELQTLRVVKFWTHSAVGFSLRHVWFRVVNVYFYSEANSSTVCRMVIVIVLW